MPTLAQADGELGGGLPGPEDHDRFAHVRHCSR